MTRLQKLQLAQSENRSALGALLDTPEDDREDTYQADLEKLTKRAKDLELELRAALVAGEESEEEETETRESADELELRELVDGALVGDVFAAALTGRPTDGQTRELQEHYGLDFNAVPLALLETRAEANNTDAPAAGERGATQQPIIPFVFPMAVASFLNVPQPTVPSGEQVYTVLSTAAAAGTPALEEDQDVSTAAFTPKRLSPARIQAAVAYRIEDRAAMAGLDEALRENLNGALADKLDAQVVANLLADGTAVDLTGTAPYTFATFHNALYGGVDGRYAGQVGEIRAVMGSDVYGAAAGFYRTANSEFNAVDELMQRGGGVRVSAHVPAIASKKAKAIYRSGARMDAVAPIWDGIEVIADRVTQAKAGQTILTAVMLYAVDTLRADPIRVVEFQNAA